MVNHSAIMEFIDYLFIFWFALTIVVVLVGDFIHKQLNKNSSASSLKSGKQDAPKDRYNNFVGDNWSNNNNQGINYDSSYTNPNYSSQYNYEYNYTNNNSAHNAPIKDHNSAQAYSNQVYGDNYEQRRASYLNNNQYTAGSSQFRGDMKYNSSSTGMYETSGSYNNSFSDRFGSSSMDNQYHALNKDNTIPTATGFNSDCVEWVNNILYIFYTQTEKYGSIVIESVYRSLNEKLSNITSSSAEYSDLIIQFVGVNRDLSTKPDLTNIRTETESEKSVSAICKIYNKRLIFYLSIAPRVSRSQFSNNATIDPILQDDHYGGGPKQTQEYELVLENLEGKLKSVAMLSEKLIVIQFMEKPDTKILLKPRFKDFTSKPLINEDTLVSIILQTLTQVVVDLFFGDDPDFPHYKGLLSNTSGYRNKLNLLKGSANEIKQQIKHDFFGVLTSPFESKERKIFVKILKANNINYNQNVTCLLELDTPYQQALSSTKQGSNPFWDEHFLFIINEKSNELLIELWDSINITPHHNHNNHDSSSRKKNASSFGKNNKKWSKSEVTSTAKFLGLARINIDELRRDPVQKVSLMLQSQSKSEQREETATEFIGSGLQVGDLSNSVGGELQVELLFLEHSSTNHSGEKQHSAIKKSSSVSSLTYQQGDVVSIDRKLTPSGYVIRTTTITKTPNQQQLQQLKQQQDVSRVDQLSVRNQSPAISSNSEQSEMDINLDAISASQISADNQSRGLNQDQQSQQGHHRSRSRSRSRSFLRAIKKRFSFSRTRSRSVGEAVSGSRSPSVLRDHDAHSTGIDGKSIESRSRASSEASIGRAKSVPASRDPNEVPIIVINKSRLSDTASAFTFTHPTSQLVIECTEPKLCADGSVKQNGQLRHYLIPDDAINKRKWSKRGLKLHIFNEHQFIACHLAGSSTCHLCGKVFSRRPGKQGYKCRNCDLLSHKQCHVKVDHNCPYATKDALNLEYIDADPPNNLVEDARASSSGSGTLPRQQQKTKRPMKLAAKSISMEVDDR